MYTFHFYLPNGFYIKQLEVADAEYDESTRYELLQAFDDMAEGSFAMFCSEPPLARGRIYHTDVYAPIEWQSEDGKFHRDVKIVAGNVASYKPYQDIQEARKRAGNPCAEVSSND